MQDESIFILQANQIAFKKYMSLFKANDSKNHWSLNETIYNVHKTDDQHPLMLRTYDFSYFYIFYIYFFMYFTYVNLPYIASFINVNVVFKM